MTKSITQRVKSKISSLSDGVAFASNSFDDAGYDGFNNIANYWSWKVDVVIMLIVIGGKCLFLDRLNILTFLNIFSKIN